MSIDVRYATPPVEICSSYDSARQAMKVCPRNPFSETYCYLVIAPPQGVHKFTNFIVRRNGCYYNSFQAISRRRNFGSQSGVIDPTPLTLTPQYGTLMNRLDETYNFPNIIHFKICSIQLLEVKNCFQAP